MQGNWRQSQFRGPAAGRRPITLHIGAHFTAQTFKVAGDWPYREATAFRGPDGQGRVKHCIGYAERCPPCPPENGVFPTLYEELHCC